MEEKSLIVDEIKTRITDQPEIRQAHLLQLCESIIDRYTTGSAQAVKDLLQQHVTQLKQNFDDAYQKLQEKM